MLRSHIGPPQGRQVLDQRGGRLRAEHFFEPPVELVTGSFIDNHVRLLRDVMQQKGSVLARSRRR